jgi:hypothetical protein
LVRWIIGEGIAALASVGVATFGALETAGAIGAGGDRVRVSSERLQANSDNPNTSAEPNRFDFKSFPFPSKTSSTTTPAARFHNYVADDPGHARRIHSTSVSMQT